MEKFLNKLIHSELLHVELIALGFILLLFILGLIFSYNIRKILYPSIIILIFFPLIWFGIKWLVSSIKQISLPSISIWVWIVIGAIIALFLIWKYWPKFSGSGRLLAYDSKTGAALVIKKSKKPYWLLFVLSGAFIVWMTIVIWSGSINIFKWRNHTTNIEESPEKKTKFEMVKMQTRNYFEANEVKSFNENEMWEIPVGESANDSITLNFTGPSGRWSYSVCKRKGVVHYHEIVRRMSFVPGTHTIRASKKCTLFLTSTKPKMLWN